MKRLLDLILRREPAPTMIDPDDLPVVHMRSDERKAMMRGLGAMQRLKLQVVLVCPFCKVPLRRHKTDRGMEWTCACRRYALHN